MQIGNVQLFIGHGDITLKDVTPAECIILTHDDSKIGHKTRAGKFPLSKLVITGEAKAQQWNEFDNSYGPETKFDEVKEEFVPTNAKRKDREEYQRLYRKYGKKKVEVVFPASAATLPEKFSNVQGWEDEKDLATVDGETLVVKPAITPEPKVVAKAIEVKSEPAKEEIKRG